MVALRADPPSSVPRSPPKLGTPVKATVLMSPPLATWRIRLSPASAMYRLSWASKARPIGRFNWAEVGGPSSPQEFVEFGHGFCGVPAKVVMTPVLASTRRTVASPCSETKRLPCESTAMLPGLARLAAVADPPSPQAGLAGHCCPLPTTGVITGGTLVSILGVTKAGAAQK